MHNLKLINYIFLLKMLFVSNMFPFYVYFYFISYTNSEEVIILMLKFLFCFLRCQFFNWLALLHFFHDILLSWSSLAVYSSWFLWLPVCLCGCFWWLWGAECGMLGVRCAGSLSLEYVAYPFIFQITSYLG